MRGIASFLTLTLKIFILMLVIIAFGGLLLSSAKRALAASLRPVTVLSGDTLTVGDIFDGLDADKASRVLGPAPQPGKDMVLNARTLLRIALAVDLPWQPGSIADQVIVRRAATTIGQDVFMDAIRDKLAEQDIGGRFELELTSVPPTAILPGSVPETADLLDFKTDPKNDSFRASFAVPSKEDRQATVDVSGKIVRYISMPVLKTSLRSGDIIGARDISWIDLAARDVQADLLLKEENLVGMTPRRMITAGKPVHDKDVEKPELVGRGDMITLVYESGPIILTAKGKSMQNGAQGDIIRVVNVVSNRTLEGMVTGDRQVTVTE